MKESSARIFMPYERPLILVFREEEWLVGGDPFHPKFWVKLTPTSVTLNDLEPLYFSEFDSFAGLLPLRHSG